MLAPRLSLRRLALLSLTAVAVAPLHAQSAAPSASPLTSWLALDAPPGHEARLTDGVLAADHRWHRDAIGNLVLSLGSGTPRRLVACGLDHVGYAVTQITDDGYLRLHRIGNARTHPLWDQFHEAQQIRVLTNAGGSVPGVIAITNAHFARQHRADTLATDVDHFWVDVGATSRADVARMGITLLDPVVRDVPPWTYGDEIAGPDASGRVACAAVASAARGTPSSGTTVFILSTQRSFNWTGLAAAVARMPHFDSITIVEPAALGARGGSAIIERHVAAPTTVAHALHADSVSSIAVRARFAGSTVESVARPDADALLAGVQRAGAVTGTTPWLTLAAPHASSRVRDSLSTTADLLARLSDLPGVPEHEWRVRDAVIAALPAWARSRARVDGAGNVVVAFGPDRDTTVVVAHMDEVSYTVASIARDGVVTLSMRGGFMPSAWESVPALLHFDPASGSSSAGTSLPGIFIPRDTGTLRRPASSRAWFGMDSVALVARGFHTGMGVTAYKHAERLGTMRFSARALDDRAGSTALLLAIARIDPAHLDHKVIFVWSTSEETGLVGATALAREIGTSVRHVYAIDTFVSSDTPLESPHFAYAPLGDGAVLRGLDDGSVVIPSEQERIESVARTNHIPLQLGATQGSTDATPFIAMGATGTGLSWPGRYSHSPAEVLDLRDLNALVRLVDALAMVR